MDNLPNKEPKVKLSCLKNLTQVELFVIPSKKTRRVFIGGNTSITN